MTYYNKIIDECRSPEHDGCPDCEPPEEVTTDGIEGVARFLHRGHHLAVNYRYHPEPDGMEIDFISEGVNGAAREYVPQTFGDYTALFDKALEQARRDHDE